MNRIYLDKIAEYTNNTYKTYNQFIKKNDLDDLVESIKQNNSLNEKGIFNKYNFIEINSIITDLEFNELVLISPLSYNIIDNVNWYNLLNSLLLVLNNEYIHETNIIRKKILEVTNNIYNKKINILNNFTNEFLLKLSNISNISLIIINYNNNKLLNVNMYENNDTMKYIVLCRNNNTIFPVINWEKRYYEKNSEFIKYLIKISDKINIIKNNEKENNEKENNKKKQNQKEEVVIKDKNNQNDNNDNSDINKITSLKKNKSKTITEEKIEKIEKIEKKDDCYEELVTNENYALYISEVTDNNTKIKKTSSDSKKKSKNSKDIFILKEIKEDENKIKEDENKKEESTFKKTEVISKVKIEELVNSIKKTSTLSDIQEIAIKLGIITVSGATKTGKPRNKTKSELIEEIQNKKQ
jgi:hypothetical protein